MAYSSAAAVARGDINTLLMEAPDAEALFIGPKVFPIFDSSVKSGQYPKFKLNTGELLNADAGLRRPSGRYPRTERSYEFDNFVCEDRGLEEAVDDGYKADVSRFFDAEVAAASNALRNVRMGHETRVASALMSATNFSTQAASVAYTEANIATIAFHKDIMDATDTLNGIGYVPDTIVMSGPLFNRIRRSTLAQNFARGAGRATDSTQAMTTGELQASLADIGIQNILVGRLKYNTGKKGKAFSGTSVWGNTYLWIGKIGNGDFMNGGAGRTIVWKEDASEPFITESYRNEDLRSDIVRVRQNTSEKVIDPNSGILVTTSYS